MSYDFVAGDTGSVLQTVIRDQAGLAINLTGSTVKYRWVSSGVVVEQIVTIVDAVNGIVEHQFTAGQLIAPQMQIEVEVIDSLGNIISGRDLITLSVRPALA